MTATRRDCFHSFATNVLINLAMADWLPLLIATLIIHPSNDLHNDACRTLFQVDRDWVHVLYNCCASHAQC